MPAELPDFWTWAQFNAKVDELAPLERKRLFGVMCAKGSTPIWNFTDGSSVYYRNQIRQAVLDLQNFIPEYCKNHETIYYPQDFAQDGEASVGALPPQAEIESAWYYSVDRRLRYPVKQLGWEHRFELASKEVHDLLNSDYVTLTAASMAALGMAETIAALKVSSRQHAGIMAISPRHDQFYCFPHVCGPWVLSVFWNGQKLDFRDTEYVPFEEEAAQAVAYKVQSNFAGYVERDMARAEEFSKMYIAKRNNIYLRTKDKGK